MAAMELGSMPSDCRRSAVSRGPSPASIRRKVPPASTRVVLPELPDPRTRKRTRQDHRPGHGRAGGNPRPERFPKETRETLTPSLLVEVSVRRGAAFAVALETPIRITESAGGSADWGFARMQIFNRGLEVERTELTATDIQRAGAGRIDANSNQVHRVIFRFNSSTFDRIDITLGFSDVKDARQFTATVPFGSFSGVDLSLTPASVAHSPPPLYPPRP